MFLCLELGIASPEKLLEQLTSYDICRWMAYYKVKAAERDQRNAERKTKSKQETMGKPSARTVPRLPRRRRRYWAETK